MEQIAKSVPGKIKAGDIVLVLLVIAAAIAGVVLVSRASAGEKGSLAIIEVNGKEVRRLELSDKQGYRTLTVQGTLGPSTVAVEDGKVWMTESACRDKLCVGMGRIDFTGQSIVCLPNRVVIRIIDGAKPGSVDAITE
ncbi:MAG: NusG domain II-containing protein [Actinobacteria bacterium]|nr:NusG domain II-containing protein [Actinomycetota bacterium]MCG2818946.1 NusG domain II-containing protein [Actinomycetes bacterium]MBU4219507.1 NusG domain II-containing protein [Actinomycetota bacterium]MBU4359133.1 NusG domain II-containing protein [Actinomycetota bacterium]MBU4392716.1 NusG domain II-containing protein [Actinomycetota bacterium]